MRRIRFPETRSFFSVAAVALLLSAALLQTMSAQTAPTLGTAQSFAVLGASAVTNTGPSVIIGDLGLFPGTSITGFPPGTVTGTTHQTDAVAMGAQADALTAYNFLAGETCRHPNDLTGMDLGGKTLTAGVYCFSSSAGLTGTLILDAQGNPNAVFIFQIGSTLITASNSSVVMINGGVPCNVFFQVSSSATLGTGTNFLGTILALTSVTLTTNATIEPGRVVALTAAVTLDSNTVSVGTCNTPTPGSLQVCKVAGSGVAVGTNFSFSIPSAIAPQPTLVTVAAGAAPLGTCSAAILVPTGAVTITETALGGTVLAAVDTLPSGLLVSSDLATGTATVTVNGGATTTVAFIDAAPPATGMGYVQVCKVAGAGVTPGPTPLFTFYINGAEQQIAAGAAPGGTCGAPVQVAANFPVTIVETVPGPGGTVPTSIFTFPSGALDSSPRPNPNLDTGTATVTVPAGGQAIVTFTDGVPAPPANVPALSTWGMIGLAGIMFLFAVWKLKARRTT
jgi:hypothetical protein